MLREQLGERRLKLTDARRRRLALKGKAIGRKRLAGAASIVTLDTVLRWYRELVARKYDGSACRRPGRPRTAQEIVDLVLRMAEENPRWGYTRIRGALSNIGHEIGRTTIRRILSEHGVEPAPERRKRSSWATFLKVHWGGVAAMDFFAVEVLTLRGVVRYFVLVVIRLESREVELAGIVHQPYGHWMVQVAWNLTDVDVGFLRDGCYVIHDRDPVYTAEFCSVLESVGVTPIRLPPKSPNLDAYVQRFVRSVKEECLDQIVPLGETGLRDIVGEYIAHYHAERNHQGLGNRLVAPAAELKRLEGAVRRRERVGGLLNYYYRAAA